NLRNDPSPLAFEATFGTGSRRADNVAALEAAKAGNAFASAIYKAAGIATMIAGTDNCDRSIQGRHPPFAKDCDCVVISGRTASRAESVTAQTSVDLQSQLDQALAM